MLLPILLLMRIALPEQIWIDVEPASFGSRALAYIIDFVLRWGSLLLMFLAAALLLSHTPALAPIGRGASAIAHVIGSSNGVLLALAILLLFLVEWSYPIYFEVCRGGVSPGKALLGLRVVDENGLPITFRTSLLRTIMILVDLMPMFGVTALISMSATRKSQRLGDLLARTMVVYSPRKNEHEDPGIERTHTADLTLPLELYNVIEKYIMRRKDLTPDARARNLAALRRAISDLCKKIEVPPLADLDAQDRWLLALYRRSKPAKQSQTKAPRDQELHWRSIRQELNGYERELSLLERQTTGLPINTLQSIALAYQQLCQRYAYLATFYPNTSAAKRTAGLVRYGRRLIYGKRLSSLSESLAPPFLERVQRSFAALSGHVALSILLMLLSGVICAALVNVNPSLGWHFLNEQTVAALNSGHLWTEQLRGDSAQGASAIMTNNIKVTLAAYALGITAGVGTAAVLIFNGVLLGGMFAALAHYRMAFALFDFVVAHGVLELSIIAVAGGCGLFIGDALLAPGSLSRKEALQERARATVDLVIFNAGCLVAAGVVEGFISPYAGIPFIIKLTIGVLLGGAYWRLLLGNLRSGEVMKTTERPEATEGE